MASRRFSYIPKVICAAWNATIINKASFNIYLAHYNLLSLQTAHQTSTRPSPLLDLEMANSPPTYRRYNVNKLNTMKFKTVKSQNLNQHAIFLLAWQVIIFLELNFFIFWLWLTLIDNLVMTAQRSSASFFNKCMKILFFLFWPIYVRLIVHMERRISGIAPLCPTASEKETWNPFHLSVM